MNGRFVVIEWPNGVGRQPCLRRGCMSAKAQLVVAILKRLDPYAK